MSDQTADEKATEALTGLHSHEAVCAIRYEGIHNKLEKSEGHIQNIYKILWRGLIAIIVTLLGIAAYQYQAMSELITQALKVSGQ